MSHSHSFSHTHDTYARTHARTHSYTHTHIHTHAHNHTHRANTHSHAHAHARTHSHSYSPLHWPFCYLIISSTQSNGEELYTIGEIDELEDLGEEIGRGGSATVKKALHRNSNIIVALKVSELPYLHNDFRFLSLFLFSFCTLRFNSIFCSCLPNFFLRIHSSLSLSLSVCVWACGYLSVFLSRFHSLTHQTHMKVIAVGANGDARKMILQELRTFYECSHTNIVTFYGAFYHDLSVYIGLFSPLSFEMLIYCLFLTSFFLFFESSPIIIENHIFSHTLTIFPSSYFHSFFFSFSLHHKHSLSFSPSLSSFLNFYLSLFLSLPLIFSLSALEYMDMGSFATVIQKMGPIPEIYLRQIALRILNGLTYIHKQVRNFQFDTVSFSQPLVLNPFYFST